MASSSTTTTSTTSSMITASSATDAGVDAGPPLTGTLDWAKTFGKSGNTTGLSVATDPSGNVVLAGELTGTANFGGGAVTSPPEDAGYGSSGFVAKFSSAGTYQWAHALDASEGAVATIVAADGSGNVYVAGYFYGTMNLGGMVLAATGAGRALFVASLDSVGDYTWAKSFTNANGPRGAVDASGNLVLLGGLLGSVDFGGGTLSPTGQSNLYLLRLDSSGAFVWANAYPCTGFESGPEQVAIDTGGNIIVAGYFAQSLDLGSGNMTSAAGSSQINGFLAKFTSDGVSLWSEPVADGAHSLFSQRRRFRCRRKRLRDGYIRDHDQSWLRSA